MEKSNPKWIQIGLINLAILAFLGTVLRYKIAFSLPFIHQKYLLHGHSHFAFSGWVSQILMVLILIDLSKTLGKNLIIKYKYLLYANLVCAYGMLISFPLQGYGFYSISFSTLSIIFFYGFSISIFREINQSTKKFIAHEWYKASFLLGIISSIGAFTLAFFMATLQKDQKVYLMSVYGFLHFQYNGWFFFAMMGLITNKLASLGASYIILKRIFWLFFLASIPGYFLSTLWLPLPTWVYLIIVIAAILQILGLLYLIQVVHAKKSQFKIKGNFGNLLLLLSLIALCIKLLLQLFSTIPFLSQIAFGYRSIVIGYLHLMLLGVISLSIIGYILHQHLIDINSKQRKGLWIFVIGVIFNQLLLMIQGLTGMLYLFVPYINEFLMGAALVMFIGLFIFNINFNKHKMDIKS